MKKNSPSILTQLIILIMITTLVPLIFFGFTTYSYYKQNIQSSIIETTRDTLNQAEQNITNLIKDISSIANYYDNNKQISTFLTGDFSQGYKKLKIIQTVENNLQEYIATINLTNIDIILVGENNMIFSTSSNPPEISINSIKKTYWYEQTMTNPEKLNWFIFDRSYFTENNNHPVVVATKSLFDYITGKQYGMIIIEIDEYYVYNLYKDVVDNEDYFIIQDSNGNVITTSDRTVQLSLNSEYSIIDIENSNLIYDYSYKDNNYIYVSQKSSIADWTLIKLLSINEINSEINYLRKTFIVVYIACVILILIGVYVIAYRITKPIQNLTSKLQNNLVNSQKNDNTISKFTFTNALTSYELLIQKVDDTVKKLLKENEARINAELHALRMQINPHFLYNTLNTVKYLVWTNKTNLIEPTINSLISLLQQTLKKPTDFITLEEELKLVKHYIFIQNIRTDNKIILNDDISKMHYSIKVPSLILQPIVENTIFHGIEPLGKKGIITLSSYKDGEDLTIEVLDNGIGISDNTKKDLLSEIYNNKQKGFNGIGLSNIHKRLQMYYGEAYGLTITSQVNVGTSVTLKIKCNNK